MMIIKKVQAVETAVKGLRTEQASKLITNIGEQLRFAINPRTLKTGVVEGRLVGQDHTGRFIATQGEKLLNGNFATNSAYGYIEPQMYSKIISENAAKTERGFLTELIEQMGLKFNMGRTKTGIVNGQPFAIEYDTGRFITATKEGLSSEGMRTQARIGRVEGFSASKEVPKEALLSFKITPRT